MQIQEIVLHGVTVHDSTTISLPDRGIVLVTGGNGSGKSTVVEGVSLTLWGKGIRGGSSLWMDGKDGSHAEVVVDGRRVRRTTSGSVRLAWEGGESYQTTTKAQEALTYEIGDRDKWRRCAVLSSTDASTFAGATDTARKMLLESIAGIESLSAAYVESRKFKESSLRDRTLAQRDLAAAQARLDVAERSVDRIASVGDSPPEEVEPPNQDVGKVDNMLKCVEIDCTTNASAISTLEERIGRAMVDRDSRSDHIGTIDGGECPTCGQALSEDHMVQLRGEEDSKRIQLDLEISTMRREQRVLYLERSSLHSEREEIREIRDGIAQRKAMHDRYLSSMREWEGRHRLLEQAREEMQEHAKSMGRAEEHLRLKSSDHAEHEAASAVLSPRGLRARLLSQTVRSLEQRTNEWLGRLSGESLAVRIQPTTPNKDGKGSRDVVLFEVGKRTGGDYSYLPYLSRSAGERRRVDVALGFGLREVADGQGSRGTLFADEIFDSLDETGRETVVEGLLDLARDRCVVVISHTADFVRPYASHHYHLEDGTIVPV